MKYTELSCLNNDQVSVIRNNGWCVFTECDEGGSYYNKGFSLVNRIGYIIFSENVKEEHINSFNELEKIASYDESFQQEVMEQIDCLRDICYLFLVKNPKCYNISQVWTNKGCEFAKELAAKRFMHDTEYIPSEKTDDFVKIMYEHNSKKSA